MLSVTRYSVKNKCLEPWIKFIWHLEAENADIHYKLLPTDCIDIVLNLSGTMLYETEEEHISASPFHINGLRSKHSYIHQTGNVHIFGISCYSFGLYPFVHKSLIGIQDSIVNLFEFAAPLAIKLEFAVSNRTSIETVIDNIEKALCQEIQIDADYVNKACLIGDFLESDATTTIQAFCLSNNVHQKTFKRTVLNYTGYTPKLLRSIQRFQKVGNQLVFQKPNQLSEIAYDNNFADQPHCIREFRKFSGSTPRTFQKEKTTVKENVEYNHQ